MRRRAAPRSGRPLRAPGTPRARHAGCVRGGSPPASAARARRPRNVRTGNWISPISFAGAAVREHPQELEDRRRAADLATDVVRGGGARRPETGDRASRRGRPPALRLPGVREHVRGRRDPFAPRSAAAGSARTGARRPSPPEPCRSNAAASASSIEVVASRPMSAAISRFSSSVTSVRCLRVITS